MFDMPDLIENNSVIVPASGWTRRAIALKAEYSHAQLELTEAPEGVWLKDGMLYVSSQVKCSTMLEVQATWKDQKTSLRIEIRKDTSLCDVPPAPLDKPGWELFYHDEFDGAELDPEHWCPYYLRGWTTDEQAYADYRLEDGCLVIGCSQGRGPWCDKDGQHRVSSIQTFERKHLHRFGDVTGARDIMDFDGFATQYGYFEIRARFPDTGDGSHFAWWMIGVQDDQNGLESVDGELYPVGEYSNQTAEYDIIEQTLDRTSENFDMNLWRPVIHPNGSRDIQYLWVPGTKIRNSAASEFHRYGLEWDETGTKFYLDGELVQQTDRTPPYRMMTLFSVYGGSRDGSVGMGPDRGIYPKEAFIDYFRVYKKREAPKVTTIVVNPETPMRCLHIPQKEAVGYKMSAQVFDQFDEPMADEKVCWYLAKDISGTEFLSEDEQQEKKVLVDPNRGVITVCADAVEGTELFLTAVHEGGRSGTRHLRLSKQEAEPVCLRFEKPMTELAPMTQACLQANLFDQYGNILDEEIRYQVSLDLTGRQKSTENPIYFVDGNTICASPDALPGRKYVVTAHAADLICSCIVKVKE